MSFCTIDKQNIQTTIGSYKQLLVRFVLLLLGFTLLANNRLIMLKVWKIDLIIINVLCYSFGRAMLALYRAAGNTCGKWLIYIIICKPYLSYPTQITIIIKRYHS